MISILEITDKMMPRKGTKERYDLHTHARKLIKHATRENSTISSILISESMLLQKTNFK